MASMAVTEVLNVLYTVTKPNAKISFKVVRLMSSPDGRSTHIRWLPLFILGSNTELYINTLDIESSVPPA